MFQKVRYNHGKELYGFDFKLENTYLEIPNTLELFMGVYTLKVLYLFFNLRVFILA